MFIFFVRHFNDIDHLTPVVWKMKQANHPVAVYCMNPRFDYHGDYRLRFLKDIGVTVDYLHDRFNDRRRSIHKFLSSTMQKAFACQKKFMPDGQGVPFYKRVLGYLSGQVGILSYKLLRFGYYDRRWARSVLEMSGAAVHELNTPVFSALGTAQLMMEDMAETEALYDDLQTISRNLKLVSELTRRMTRITRYEAKAYVGETNIVDIQKASDEAFAGKD